ncbi:MAG: methyltransferase, TIGR04325 family [Steroidobacteraceae bacterium]
MLRSELLPPAIERWLLRLAGRASLRGDFPSWQAALAASAAYRTDVSIYGRFAEEARSGKRSSSRLLSPLLAAMLLAGGRPRVLDFGGNLGHVYFDLVRLRGDCAASWSVVDLEDIVAYGNVNFSNENLHFYESIGAACGAAGNPNVVLLFHVLQYLPSPWEYVAQLKAVEPECIVLNEFPVGRRERFMIQDVLPELGGGSRPVRIFDEADVAAAFAGYDLIEELRLPPWDRALAGAAHVARLYRRKREQFEVAR